jgi:hypothetical protein
VDARNPDKEEFRGTHGSQINPINNTVTVEYARTRALLNGVIVELDGMQVRESDWPALLAANPHLGDWRLLRFPRSGWLVAVEPAHVVLARYRQGLLEASTPERN